MTEYLSGLISAGPDSASTIDSIGRFLAALLNVLTGIGLALSIFAFVIAGIQFVASMGDPKKTTLARQSITYAVYGLVLTLVAVSVRIIILTLIGTGGEYLEGVPSSF